MPVVFSQATEAALIGKKIIKDQHEHLLRPKVVFLFADKQNKDGGSEMITKGDRNIYGKAKLVSGLNAYLSADIGDEEGNPFFVILITKFSWNYLTKEQKAALIDHELCHCYYDTDTGKASMIDHDVEEFTSIIKRHGVWNEGLDKFFKAGRQNRLPFEDPMPVKVAAESVAEPAPAEGDGAGKKGAKKSPAKKSASKKPPKRQPSAQV